MKLVDKLLNIDRNYKQIIKFIYLLLLSSTSLFLAFLLSGDQQIYNSEHYILLTLNLIFTILFLIKFKLYKNIFRTEDRETDKIIFIFQIICSLILAIIVNFFFSSSIKLTSPMIHLFVFIVSYVALRRLIFLFVSWNTEKDDNSNVIGIYGAGSLGFKILKLLKIEKPYMKFIFIDDDLSKQKTQIDNHKVYSINDLENLKNKFIIKELILGIQNIDLESKNKIITKISKYHIPIRSIPKITDSNDNLTIKNIKNIDDSDFFENKFFISEETREFMLNKSILVTGAGGSIGSEICSQLSNLNIKKLYALDSNEYNLFKLKENIGEKKIEIDFILINLFDYELLKEFFKKKEVNLIFHAAAYKHVDLLENNIKSGIKNNIISLINTINCFKNHDIKKFILISSDKAVRPSSIMGFSKRVCELIIFNESINSHSTVYSSVRFGNVIGSSGSVIPKFLDQLSLGQPLTVSDLNATRYFMTIPDAVSLVLETSMISTESEIYVLDMGSPINIFQIAKKILQYSGVYLTDEEYIKKNKIKITGMKKGEKLSEEIFINDNYKKTSNKAILVSDEFINFNNKKYEAFMRNLLDKINILSIDDFSDFIKSNLNKFNQFSE